MVTKEFQPLPLVLVNAAPLRGVLSGIARYTRSLYTEILAAQSVYVLFFSRGKVQKTMPDQNEQSTNRFVPGLIRMSLRRVRATWMKKGLLKIAKKTGASVYHETGLTIAPRLKGLMTIITLYDLSLMHYPECHPKDRVEYFEGHFLPQIGSVDHIITISDFVATELIESLGIPKDRVTSIHLAADPIFGQRPMDRVMDVRLKFGLPEQYMLYVGTLEPRKNLVQVARAMSQMVSAIPLVCAGRKGWLNMGFESEVKKLKIGSRIIHLGVCSDEDLAALYTGATVFVYPSLYEGFGLPVLEAMACGCPVVCSDRASLPEVAGNAAIQVSAEDDHALAVALDNVIENVELQQQLSVKGMHRADEFSWGSTAKRTLEVFDKVCSR